MPTLQAPHSAVADVVTPGLPQRSAGSTASASPATPESRIEAGFNRISPSLMRVAAETSAAFLCVPASLGSSWDVPRFSIPDVIHCSQMNMGDNHQMLFNLSVEKPQWEKLFAADIPDRIKSDAWCELANCICGAILADAAFTDEFGCMIPCVPCNGASRPAAGSRVGRGSMIVGGAWIRFSFAVRENDA